MSVFGIPGQQVDTLAYVDNRLSVVPSVQAPRRPTINDKKFPLWCEWRTNKHSQLPVAEGEFWKLIKFESNGDATWVQFTAGGVAAGLSDIRDGSNVNVTPAPVTLTIDVDANIIANAGTPFTSVANPGTHTLDLNIQVSKAVTATPGTNVNIGMSCFNDAQFTVDAASGMVSMIGNAVNGPVLVVNVDQNTAPGTNPVLASGTGQITVGAALVPAHSVPIETRSRAVNSYKTEVQVASVASNGAANTNACGLLCANTAQFTLNATNGVLSLKGSTTLAPILTITGNDANAISPDASGNVNLVGSGTTTVTGTGTTLTISGGFTWHTITVPGTTSPLAFNGYFANSTTGIITFPVPTGASGDEIRFVAMGSSLFELTCTGTVRLRFGDLVTTLTTGKITATDVGDNFWLLCRAANDWTVCGAQGDLAVS